MELSLVGGLPCPPSQLCDFSCKRFTAIYKEMYEKFSRPGWLGVEGNPPTRDNFSPYKQALRPGIQTSVTVMISFVTT